MTEHNAHFYAFCNAPLHQKRAWAKLRIAVVQAELDSPEAACGRSADGYYALKDELRRLCAGLTQKSEREYDPMGFWFGRQSA